MFEKREIDFSRFSGLRNLDLETGRVYVDDTGRRYPSITTVLGKFKDLSGWRQCVGEEEANRILDYTGKRGSNFHECLEHYVLTGEHKKADLPNTDKMVRQIEKILDKDLDAWVGQEIPLYSDIMRIAGRTDLLGWFRGKPSVIDYKTSLKQKTRYHIGSYWEQTCAYGICLREFTKFRPTQLVILMATDGTPQAQCFIEDFKDWVSPTFNTIMKYHQLYGE